MEDFEILGRIEEVKTIALYRLVMTSKRQSLRSYVLCIDDGGYPESLEARKVYAVLPDERAGRNNYLSIQIPPDASSIVAAKMKRL